MQIDKHGNSTVGLYVQTRKQGSGELGWVTPSRGDFGW